jgi:ABC-type transport system substrate-binding protein
MEQRLRTDRTIPKGASMIHHVMRASMRCLVLIMLGLGCSANAADPAKVLRVALIRAETGFDPAMASEIYSSAVIAAIMEPLLTFDYLARPVKIIPLTAAALPEVTDDGKTYTFRIRPGIFFADDPAFKGRRRELIAEDYIYSIKRLVDPAMRSPNAFYVAGKIVGLDDAARAASKTGAFDYGARIAGLEAVDRYTLRIRLTGTDYTFASVMALPILSAVAREVVEAYPGKVQAHPVGTGQYVLKSWVPASKITLEANPTFREATWNFAAGDDPGDRAIVAALRGRKMPLVGTIEISVMEEQQSRWLAFQRGELDILELPGVFAPVALRGDQLSAELAAKGVYLSRILDPTITYTAFNMRDPVVGGSAKEKVALRRAIVMAYDTAAEIAIVRKGQGMSLQMPIPPGVAGYAPGYRAGIRYDPVLANRLLDQMGYRKGADGFRTQPDGKPLTIRYSSQTDATARDFDELWKKSFDSIGIRMEVVKGKFSDQIKAGISCQYQMWGYGWQADYPDGDNFMQLLYSPNINQSNVACYASPEYDALYRKSRQLADSPERTALFEQMARQFEADTPWRLRVAPYRNLLAQPRVIGYKAHPVLLGEWIYVDVETRPQ